MHPKTAFATVTVAVPDDVRAALRSSPDHASVGAAAAAALLDALPEVQRRADAYIWPRPRRARNMPAPRAQVSVAVPLPLPLLAEYRSAADQVLVSAVAAGRVSSDAPTPLQWLIRAALIDHVLRTSEFTAPLPPEVGPMVVARLPAALLAWIDKHHGNRSAFIRGAVDAQLPALERRGSLPPMSALLPDAPAAQAPVRMPAPMHGALRSASTQFASSMTHVVRACCLLHFAHLNHKEPR